MPTYDPRPRRSGTSLRDLAGGDSNIVNLILNRGQIEAEGTRARGENLANTITSAGAMIGQGLQARSVQKAEETKRAELKAQDNAFMSRISDKSLPAISPEETLSIFGVERGPAIHNGFASLHSDKPDLKLILAGHKAASPEMQAMAWPQEHALLVKAGVPIEQLPPPDKYDPHFVPRLEAALAKQGEAYTLAPGGERRGPNDELLARNAPAPESRLETRGIDVQAAEALANGDTETYNRLLKVKKEMGQADDRPRITVNTPSGMSPSMEANVINRLSKQWGTAVAPVVELDRQVKLLDTGLAAARKGDMAQGAQTVLVTFQKILDPPSVVRESEYARSASGLALIERVKGAYEQLLKGGAGVSVSQLEKFADVARQAARAQASGYSQAVQERIGKTADRYKIPRELVFEEFDFNFNAPGGAPAMPGGGAEPTATGPNGQKLVLRNGQWVPAQ